MTLPVNSSFSTVIPQLQIAWDSTSLGTFKECPRKYYYSIILGYTPREESVHLVFGLLYHAALERYDHAKSAGQDHAGAMRATVKWMMGATWNNELKRPWSSDDPNKNRFTLVRTVIWYLDQFEHDSLETVQLANGKPAVELSFRMQLPAYPPGEGLEPYMLCGHMDRLVRLNGVVYVLDRKTTKNTLSEKYFAQYSPDNQFSTYSLAGKVIYSQNTAGLIVDAAQIAVTFSRFQRGFVSRTDEVLNEWLGDTVEWIHQAEDFAQQGKWPMNDKSCDKYGGCPYRKVCNLNPSARGQWLQSAYVKRVWDPLQIRGDI